MTELLLSITAFLFFVTSLSALAAESVIRILARGPQPNDGTRLTGAQKHN
jgi:hypothetical protein